MKKILYITYQIPPIAGPATQRNIRFIANLRSFRIEPIILTIKPRYRSDHYLLDDGLRQYLPENIITYRSLVFNPFNFLMKLKSKLSKNRKIEYNFDYQKNIKSEKESKYSRIKDFISALFRIPDIENGWIAFGTLRGLIILIKHNISNIYSSGGPWSTHLIALILVKLSNKKWIADFRDPWTRNPYKIDKFKIIKNIEKKLEWFVIKNATFVITNTEALRLQFIQDYPMIKEEKFIHIGNGFLEQQFKSKRKVNNTEKLIISHVGTLYAKRNPIPLLKIISELKKEKLINSSNFCLQFVGVNELESLTDGLLKKLNIIDLVKFLNPVPHYKALDILNNSSYNLIIQNNTKLQIPGKIYESIALEKPIIAITNEGATADLIRNNNMGIILDPNDDIENIKKIKHLIINFNDKKIFKIDSKLKNKFEAYYLTSELVSLLKDTGS